MCGSQSDKQFRIPYSSTSVEDVRLPQSLTWNIPILSRVIERDHLYLSSEIIGSIAHAKAWKNRYVPRQARGKLCFYWQGCALLADVTK